jgi:carbon monoxide dehydrogenase subunit G
MELNNDFRVAVDRPTAWKALTDLERIAPLLPGAQLQEVEGDEYRGIVKVKVGPIQAQYKGTATLVETDESAGRMVMKASGRDTRGQGNASATITITVAEDGEGTKVTAATDLTISGKVAQFGRGVLADVSSKLIGQFAANLEKDLSAAPAPAAPTGSVGGADRAETNGAVTAPAEGEVGPGTTAPTTTSATSSSSRTPSDDVPATAATHSEATSEGTAGGSGGARKIDSPEPEPVDLFDAAGNPMIKRLLPVLGGVGLVVVLLVVRRRRKRSRAQKALATVRSHTPDLGDLDTGALLDAGKRVADRGRHAADVGLHAAGSATDASRKAAKQAVKDGRKTARKAAKRARGAAEEAAKKSRKTAAKAAKEARKQAQAAQAEATKRAHKAQAEAAKRAHRAQARAAAKAAKKGGKATLQASAEAVGNGAKASRDAARSATA